jgi:class 3 adenylate cyclase
MSSFAMTAMTDRTTMAEERMERRLSAILAADIAGYSALMGADEARTYRFSRTNGVWAIQAAA